MTATENRPRTWSEHPDLNTVEALPGVRIVASKLRAGMVLLDPEFMTPAASLDHKVRSANGSGTVDFLALDYDRSNYVTVSLHRNAMVWVATA